MLSNLVALQQGGNVDEFTWGGLHEKHVVAIRNLGTILEASLNNI
jgi:hypothetical protein